MMHNDYLKLKNELNDYASSKAPPAGVAEPQQEQQENAGVFSNLAQLVSYFKDKGHFNDEEYECLTQMMESGSDKHLTSIWNAHQVIRMEDDCLENLKALVDVRLKKG